MTGIIGLRTFHCVCRAEKPSTRIRVVADRAVGRGGRQMRTEAKRIEGYETADVEKEEP